MTTFVGIPLYRPFRALREPEDRSRRLRASGPTFAKGARAWFRARAAEGDEGTARPAAGLHSGLIWKGSGCCSVGQDDRRPRWLLCAGGGYYGKSGGWVRTVLHRMRDLARREGKPGAGRRRSPANELIAASSGVQGLSLLRGRGISRLPAATTARDERGGSLRDLPRTRRALVPRGDRRSAGAAGRRWNCRRIGSPAISGGTSRTTDGRRCGSCSSASGIARPGRILPRRPFRSTAASRCAAASRSIPMRGIGSATATRRIPHYESVVLHVFTRPGAAEFFTRTAQHRLVPQVLLDLDAAYRRAACAAASRLGPVRRRPCAICRTTK